MTTTSGPDQADMHPGLERHQTEEIRKRLRDMLADIRSKGEETMRYAPDSFTPMADVVDRASSETSSSITFRLRDREYRLIRKIHQAMQRLEDGTYGICLECGDPIAPARLMARPVTTLCVDCKQEQERDETRRDHVRRVIAPE